MRFQMLYSKIHKATVTDANLHYQGSITIDQTIAQKANLIEGIKVDILNLNNAERLSTYVIFGPKDSGTICLNGAAARKAQIGDTIIIIAYATYSQEELSSYAPTVIFLDEHNQIQSIKHEV